MGTNSYETGRSNLPFMGISTFGKTPASPTGMPPAPMLR
jgi:hypothetical protein